jgi:hypothetical protein
MRTRRNAGPWALFLCFLFGCVPRDERLAMSTSTGKLKAKLSALNLSLDELEAELEPLLAQTLPETVVNLAPVQQAKLQVLLPYLVHGLIFGERFLIYCRLWRPD